MSSPPTDPHLHALDTLIAIGTALAEDIRDARAADGITPAEAAEAFERVARATRRTVLLAAHLARSPAQPPTAETEARAARRELIRTVEDAIHREERLDPPARHALEAEFRERLDAPELAEDLAARPVAAVVKDILRDMDLGRLPFTGGPNWRRRTPETIRRLHALAAGTPVEHPPGPAPSPHPPAETKLTLRQLHRHILAATPPH